MAERIYIRQRHNSFLLLYCFLPFCGQRGCVWVGLEGQVWPAFRAKGEARRAAFALLSPRRIVQTLQIEAGPPLVFTSTYEYDVDNRLVATYGYEGLGNLLQITDAGMIRRLVRDQADESARALLRTDASGSAMQANVGVNVQLVARAQVEARKIAVSVGHLL